MPQLLRSLFTKRRFLLRNTITYYTITCYTNTLIVEATSSLNTTRYTLLYLYFRNTIIVETTTTLEYYTNTAEEVPFAVVLTVKSSFTWSNRLNGIEKEMFTTYWRQTSPNGASRWKNIDKIIFHAFTGALRYQTWVFYSFEASTHSSYVLKYM